MEKENAKKIIDYNRQIEMFGTMRADIALDFFILGANNNNENLSIKNSVINFALEAILRHDEFAQTKNNKNIFKLEDKWVTIDELYNEIFKIK